MEEDRFAHLAFAKDAAGSLEHDELDERVRVKLEHHGGAGDGRRDGRSIDLCPPGILRHAQEHGAPAELEVARSLVETENRVRAKAGEGLIGKGQLGARLDSGADGGTIANCVVNGSCSRRSLLRKELDVLDHLADAGLFQLRGIPRLEGENDRQEQAAKERIKSDSPGLAAERATKQTECVLIFHGGIDEQGRERQKRRSIRVCAKTDENGTSFPYQVSKGVVPEARPAIDIDRAG